jgi:RNA-directed DNA polymerase
MLRGWFGYFKHAKPYIFGILDGFVRRRLRAILRKQDRRPSMGRSDAEGLFTLFTAYEDARYSR